MSGNKESLVGGKGCSGISSFYIMDECLKRLMKCEWMKG
jgi:hypothetical protein